MTALLEHTVREFEDFAYDRNGFIDTRRWKAQYSHEDLNMYREREVGATSSKLARSLQHCNLQNPTFSTTAAALSPPTMMLTGWGPGRVENAMSAVITESQQDLSLVVTYMHQDVADCAIIHTMEHPTDAAPYHYFGYKYFVKKSPTNAVVVKHRDSLYLEFCGMTKSRTGETLGFHLMQSVELSQFPDLSGHNSIRALQSSRYLYRQKSDRVVEVFMLGNMDISGMIVKPIANMFSAEALFGVTRLLDLAEVRRLTEMARDRQRNRGLLASNAADQSYLQYSTASTHVPGDNCGVCKRDKTIKMVECHLCGQGVCQRCRSTKRVWVSDKLGIMGSFRKIRSCSVCVMHANTGAYDLPAQRVRSQRPQQGSANANSSESEVTSESATESTISYNGVLYEDTNVASRRKHAALHDSSTRRRSKTAQQVGASNEPGSRRFIHQGALFYPDSAAGVVPTDCLSPEYEVPNRLVRRPVHASRSYSGQSKTAVNAAGYSQSLGSSPKSNSNYQKTKSFEGVPSEQVSVMARLMELTTMAEATSYKTQANGIYLEQQMQQQFTLPTTAKWRN
ncbi:hypothetical protein PHYBOEH_009415 [Phytophthora boehmeriae]|uniref:FYVE-type domain-containing protein n=1 Tax=Phytophthora boehmeriae TaxID=109152 RepID=A0A8T1VTN8_9STRA|nr:hypothetical protein PHYBOEH_009415 [Phytophthora boehmeriae]